MFFIDKQAAIENDPGEKLYAIEKHGDTFTILSDIEENLNVFGDEEGYDETCGIRVEFYGWYGGDWTLDNELLFDENESAIGEARGSNAGGICFGYESLPDWADFDNAYDCLFSHADDGDRDVVVLDSLEELKELDDGVWCFITEAIV